MDSWSLEIDRVTLRLREDPGVSRGPEGCGGAQRSGDHIRTLVCLNPEVVMGPASEAVLGPEGLNPKIADRSSLDPEIFDWNPEAIGEPGGTVLRRPRQGYYRKSLTSLGGYGVGVMTHVQGFAAFHVWRSMILIAPWTPMRLRLHRGFR
ncbi:hypothetical protein F2Q69_00006815 [Brassica cretica]|uniref:Uncharacterized protein n=1 Tax=Brassica cretica TaxID=69181 RepID=A0A8S9NUT5_BRACR|nr:hypothetical protein F2Q69_00006815 [Brassica cretica]